MQATDVRSVYASGTAYSVTNSSAAVDFGTTDPSLTLTLPGTYLLFARVDVDKVIGNPYRQAHGDQ